MSPFSRPLVLLLAAVAAASAAADAPPVTAYERDIEFLATKVSQHRHGLRRASESSRLAELESGVQRLRNLLAELKSAAGDIGSYDSRLRYLRTMEIEPKLRELERIRRELQAEQDELSRLWGSLGPRIQAHNAEPHTFTLPDQQAASDAYHARYLRLNAERDALLKREADNLPALQRRVDAAMAAYSKVQNEVAEVERRRYRAAEQFQDAQQSYGDQRQPVVAVLEQLEQEAAAAVASVPLTPFSQPAPGAADGEITPRQAPPIGPGNNVHALDQLRVITVSSQSAATQRAGPAAVEQGRLGFDQGGGLGVAPLPVVDLSFDPTATSAEADTPHETKPEQAVPLVVPESAPVASPGARVFAEKKAEGLTRLESLYAERQQLMQAGAAASPAAWSAVVNGISRAQAEVNFAAVAEALQEQGTLDLTVRVRPQQKRPEPPSPK